MGLHRPGARATDRSRSARARADQSALQCAVYRLATDGRDAIPNNEKFKDRDRGSRWARDPRGLRRLARRGAAKSSPSVERWTMARTIRGRAGQLEQDVRALQRRLAVDRGDGARGFSDTTMHQDDFPAEPNAVPTAVVQAAPPQPGPMRLSDMWLADECSDDIGDRLRYVAARGAWYVWTGSYWVPDRDGAGSCCCGRNRCGKSRYARLLASGAAVVPRCELMESANTLGACCRSCGPTGASREGFDALELESVGLEHAGRRRQS